MTREVTKSYSNHKAKNPEDQDASLGLSSTWPGLFPLYHATRGFDLEVISLKPFLFIHEETEAQIATVTSPGTETRTAFSTLLPPDLPQGLTD